MRKYRRLGLSRRTWIIILIMVLAAGFLIYSTILLLLNRFMHPADFAGLPNYMELIERRLEIRLFAEKVHGFCAAIALLGGCMVVYDFIKAGSAVPFRKLFALFGGIAVGLLACAGIFSLLDQSAYGDYFFQIYGTVIYLIIAFVIVMIFNLGKQRRLRQK